MGDRESPRATWSCLKCLGVRLFQVTTNKQLADVCFKIFSRVIHSEVVKLALQTSICIFFCEISSLLLRIMCACVPGCGNVHVSSGALRSLMRAPDAAELELQVVLSFWKSVLEVNSSKTYPL